MERGKCKFGSACTYTNCKFSHSDGGSPVTRPRVLQKDMCRFGTACTYTDCKYSHSTGASPDTKPRGLGNMCRFGSACTYTSCKFDHDPPRDSPPPLLRDTSARLLEKNMCRFGAACTYTDCKFSHPGTKARVLEKDMCRFGGACTYTDCKFSHPGTKARVLEKDMCRFGAACTYTDCKFSHSPVVGKARQQGVCFKGLACKFKDCKFKHPERETLSMLSLRTMTALSLGRQRSNQTATCSVCQEQKDTTEGMTCPQRHFICFGEDCLAGWVSSVADDQARLTQSLGRVPCVGQNCTHAWSMMDMEGHLDEKVRRELHEAMLGLIESLVRSRAELALELATAPETPPEPTRDSQRDSIATEDTIRKTTKRCPSCATSIEKNGGCKHMTCAACSQQFCWLCMRQWPCGCTALI